ncbi:unnamed protein product [Amoebophrya sp. A25]|nr:unnamed protein product [Amoebophrya sp. A25]|eukprot:GSA25T00003534001.1
MMVVVDVENSSGRCEEMRSGNNVFRSSRISNMTRTTRTRRKIPVGTSPELSPYISDDFISGRPLWTCLLDCRTRVPANSEYAYNFSYVLAMEILEWAPHWFRLRHQAKQALPNLIFVRNFASQLVMNTTSYKNCPRCTNSQYYCKCAFTFNRACGRIRKVNRGSDDQLCCDCVKTDLLTASGRFKTLKGVKGSLPRMARENLFAIDDIIARLHINLGDTWRQRTLKRKLDQYNNISDINRGSSKVCYLAYQPFSKKAYVGETVKGFDTRITGHMRKAFVGTQFFYRNTSDFWRYMFIPIVYLPEATPQKQVRAIESNLIDEFHASQNTQGVNDYHMSAFLHSETLINMPKRKRLLRRRKQVGPPRQAHPVDISDLAAASRTTSICILLSRRILPLLPPIVIAYLDAAPTRPFILTRRAKHILEEQEHEIFIRNLKKVIPEKVRRFVLEVGETKRSQNFWDYVAALRAIYYASATDDSPAVNLCIKSKAGPTVIDFFKKSNWDYHEADACNCKNIVHRYPMLKAHTVEGHIMTTLEKFRELLGHKDFIATDQEVGKWNTRSRFLSPLTTRVALKKSAMRFAASLNNTSDLGPLGPVLDCVVFEFSQEYEKHGIRPRDIRGEYQDLCRVVNTDLVDKDVDMSCTCPHILRRLTERHMQPPTYQHLPGFASLFRDNENAFFWLFPDTNIRRKIKHRWATMRMLLKKKSYKILLLPPEERKIIDVKYRPLTSYVGHCFADILQTAARVANDIMERDPRAARCFLTSPENIKRYVKEVEEKARQLRIMVDAETGDIGEFFTNCDLQRSLARILIIIDNFRRLAGFNYARVSKAAKALIPVTHALGARAKTYFVQKGKRLQKRIKAITYTKKKPDTRFYDYVRLDEVVDILRHDVNFCYVRALGSIYKQVNGAPMGSYTSTPLSNGFAIDVELEKGAAPGETGRRYADDKIVFRLRDSGSTDTPTLLASDFYPGCTLVKDEEDDINFCGLDILVDNSSPSGTRIEVIAGLTGKPIASALSAGMRTRIKGVVRGHLARLRLNSTIPPIDNIKKLVGQMIRQKYPAKIVLEELDHMLNHYDDEHTLFY